MHNSEIDEILSKMTKLYPNESDLKKKFETATAKYKTLDCESIKTIIKDSFKYFDHVTVAEKYKIYTDMYDILNADGKIKESEKHILQNLREIIDLNTTPTKE